MVDAHKLFRLFYCGRCFFFYYSVVLLWQQKAFVIISRSKLVILMLSGEQHKLPTLGSVPECHTRRGTAIVTVMQDVYQLVVLFMRSQHFWRLEGN